MQERRILKINELIKRELGKIIKKELDIEPGTLVTITDIKTSSDLTETKVWLSIFPFNRAERVLNRIYRIKNYIQRLLNKQIVLYQLPKLKFLLDRTEEEASQIEKILD